MNDTTSKLIQGRTGPWEVVIGLEVHAQITSQAKLFSGASTAFGADPNTQVSFVDAAFPGMLPVINRFCVEQAVRTGLGLNAHIHLHSVFDRKNYFYADLPQGYQISQFSRPLVGKGYLEIQLPNEEPRRIGITRLHLEQDAGKSIHDQHPAQSLIDLNRAGVALMEIVSEPDMRSIEEAQAYMKKLRALLRYLGTCDGNMEQGSLRADINISLRRPGGPYGTRTEIKNVNSIRFMGQALQYEIQRQLEILEEGGVIDQETRLFDAARGITRSMRSKEDAHDYRYFPDPDLPPLVLSQEFIDRIRASLPELPDQKKNRYIQEFGLTPYDADVLTSEVETAVYFEAALKAATQPALMAKPIANWIIGELFAILNRENCTIDQSRISPQDLVALIELIVAGTISGKIAKEVFVLMWDTQKNPVLIVEEQGLQQVSDDQAILRAIEEMIQQNMDKVAEYRAGKDKLFGFFVGQVMRKMQGKANPALLNTMLKKYLDFDQDKDQGQDKT
jgi:aspartyl-tRNA(Asn)/glutamyl-tRNA(Gln) amidotransferase subunit B